MRAWIVAFALVAGCKGGKGKDKPAPSSPAAAKAALTVPKVEVATVLATEAKPPFLLLVDEKGEVRVAAAASWADLDANKLKIANKAGPLDPIDRFVRESHGLGQDPMQAIASWDEYGEGDIDLAALDDTSPRTNPATMDDPPPPEEEDAPDDGEDESGGTGTAIALEEGKMGKRDADRAEGQYKMQKTQEDPQLARQQAIEQARAAGILGARTSSSSMNPGMNEDGTPSRVAQVIGMVAADGKHERFRAMVFIAPTAKATKLIEVIRDTGAAIAVSHAGKIRPLRLDFGVRDGVNPARRFWVEARVSAKGIVVEAVPDAPIEVADIEQLAAALETARDTRGAEPDSPVDVLVDAEVDAQRLVDLLVALDTAGVRAIGMGTIPPPEQLARRGRRIPTASLGQPSALGDLEKAVISKVVKAGLPKIQACYAKALELTPTLAGTVVVAFSITPKGTVASSNASGVDPELATCVAGVVKTLVFPKPKGGGIQVNLPVTMRP